MLIIGARFFREQSYPINRLAIGRVFGEGQVGGVDDEVLDQVLPFSGCASGSGTA